MKASLDGVAEAPSLDVDVKASLDGEVEAPSLDKKGIEADLDGEEDKQVRISVLCALCLLYQ